MSSKGNQQGEEARLHWWMEVAGAGWKEMVVAGGADGWCGWMWWCVVDVGAGGLDDGLMGSAG